MRRQHTAQLGEYRGKEISVKSDGMFRCEELSIEHKTLDALKALIDDGAKKRLDIQAYFLEDRYGGHDAAPTLKIVTITSVVDQRYSSEAYITHLDKKREKVSPRCLFEITDDNETKLNKIVANRTEIALLIKEYERIEKSLKPAVK